VKIGFHSHVGDEEVMKDYFLWISVAFEAITLTFKMKKRERKSIKQVISLCIWFSKIIFSNNQLFL